MAKKNATHFIPALALILLLSGVAIGYALFGEESNPWGEIDSHTGLTTNSDTPLCTTDYAPVCGTDGRTYSNRCVAEKQNAIMVASEGACPLVSETDESEPLPSTGGTMTDSVTAPEYIGSDIEMRANPETITSEAVMGSSSDMSESSTRTGSVLESPSAVISTSVATYDNPVVGYGFDMPKSSYYQGFGARDGAVHSVAVQAGTGVTTFEDATVRVLLYRSILEPLMENGRKIISDEESGRVYVRIGTGMTAVVEASSMDDPTARVIVESLREARTTPATDDIVAPIGQ